MNRTTESASRKRSDIVQWIEDVLVTHHIMELLCMITDLFPSLVPGINKMCRKVGFGHKERIDASYKIFTFPGFFTFVSI
jgi:hypothetical protein